MLDLIVLGSITEDLIITPKEEKRFIGGVPVYAAATAKVLNSSLGIVSKVGVDFHLKNLDVLNSFSADLNGFKIEGQTSMKFENKYSPKGKRTQKLLSTSEKIFFYDIPESYFQSHCIHLGPVFNEINTDLLVKIRDRFKLVSLDGQGFTRSIEKGSKKIILKPWLNYSEYLPLIDILKVDDTELMGITATTNLDKAIDLVLKTDLKFLVITRAHKGAIIYHNNQRYDIPAVPTTVVDETGAGDTFITAFLLEYLRTKDCYYSALMAACTASYKISHLGPIPNYTRDDVISKLKSIYPDFIEK
ncbi:MAG TPA: PfkB family carbohydrate kinase [Candidatus Bathyarchaeia archaeon]|nr:PfkB family carbohydrate kinase [Candidatus Bathyarchaeia archaeon]